MDIPDALLLGLIQGITEWLPISSSAHLALAQAFFGIEASIAFDIILHLGTLFAVLAFYRNDILSLGKGIIRKDAGSIRLAMLIIIVAVPTAIIGLLLKDAFESMYSNPIQIAGALALTGIFLILVSSRTGNRKPAEKDALLIGIAQGIAVAPGISRSGSTIGTALLLGIDKEEAARFSFLSGVIPILGATILEGRHALDQSLDLLPLCVGFVTAAIVGYLSIGLLLKGLKDGQLHWFGYYCLALAATVSYIVLS